MPATKEEMFIARLWKFPALLGVYKTFLDKITFEALLGEVIESFKESYKLFGEIQENFLKERFAGRDDLNLFMAAAAEAGETLENDIGFAKYWVGKYLADRVRSSIRPDRETSDVITEKALAAKALERIADGNEEGQRVWDFIEESEARLARRSIDRYVLKTGIPRLDEQVKMSDGTVTVFMAPYKRYKSILLTNIGCAALAQGLSVFHLHYEGKQSLWETRYDACMTGIAKDRLYANMNDNEKERYRKVYARLKERSSRIYFMSGVPEVTSITEVENELRILKNSGKEFQVIVVDYLNLLRPTKGRSDSDWLSQGDQAWDLVRLSHQGYIVVSAAQTKISGVEKEVLKSQDLGRSIIIQQAITNLIAINQNNTEKDQGILRLNPLFLRDGDVTFAEIKLEMSLWKMRISRDMDRLLDNAFLGDDTCER